MTSLGYSSKSCQAGPVKAERNMGFIGVFAREARFESIPKGGRMLSGPWGLSPQGLIFLFKCIVFDSVRTIAKKLDGGRRDRQPYTSAVPAPIPPHDASEWTNAYPSYTLPTIPCGA